ncbi:DNA helicase [Ranunculus cassubicifolius]
MGVHLDTNLASGRNGIYTYRAQGAIYHRIGSLFPQFGQRPRFLQMYLYDTDHEIENRLAENETLNPQVLAILKQTLDDHNAFVHVLRQISTLPSHQDVRLHLKEGRPNQHQYNLPTSSQVAAILIDGEDPYDRTKRDIIVETNSDHLLNLPDTAGFYDPLQYPLLHPYGELGWDVHLHNSPPNKISCRAFYCYLLQVFQHSLR